MKNPIDLTLYTAEFKCRNEMTDEWYATVSRKSDGANIAEYEITYLENGKVRCDVTVNVTDGMYNPASAYLFWPIIEEKIAQYFE